MKEVKKKIDFNNPDDSEAFMNKINFSKNSEKLKINLKLVIVFIIYFIACGLGLNIYWLVNLILNLF